MSNIELLEKTLPMAPLKIVALDSCKELGQKVNDYIVSLTFCPSSLQQQKLLLN